MADFDYLVVGGGTSGCVLAERLSNDLRTRVPLLEAGQSEGPAMMTDPAAWPGSWGSAAAWADTTMPQRGSDGVGHARPRGKVLGGSSGITGMVHLRGHESSYDQWEALGARGWDYQALLPFPRRSETPVRRDRRVHGTDGPMLIAPPAEPDPLSRARLGAAAEAGHPITDDGNGSVNEGVSWTSIVSANTNATVLAIAEKAAALISPDAREAR